MEQELKSSFKQSGQDHVFHYWNELSDGQQKELLAQLKDIDPSRINSIFKQATKQSASTAPSTQIKMDPLPANCYDDVDRTASETVENWRKTGMESIAKGKVGVVLLAGGQGTRLGSSLPKGCYDINLPSHKSLFQLQAERIKRLQEMSKLEFGKSAVVPWYVMTSGPTRADTEKFFKDYKYFGLAQENIMFFEQGVLPALTNDGKIIMEDKHKISVAPDGNGGVYAALRQCKIIEDAKKRGIAYLHFYCVDNCLVRVADPVFMGYCIGKGAACGAKVVKKAFAHEPVGVVCKVNGKFGVVEYSEIRKEDAELKTSDGRLAYDAANIANHFYTVSFLEKICSREFEEKLAFHVANKKIKHINFETNEIISPAKPNGIKLELFIFDIFPLIDEEKQFAVLSVPRKSEFSPLKNAPGTGIDNPETSRHDLFAQSIRFLQASQAQLDIKPAALEQIKMKEAGAEEKTVEIARIEISPLVSYDGEGLSGVVGGKKLSIKEPVYIDSIEKLKSLLV